MLMRQLRVLHSTWCAAMTLTGRNWAAPTPREVCGSSTATPHFDRDNIIHDSDILDVPPTSDESLTSDI
jgi:hypothetical protein